MIKNQEIKFDGITGKLPQTRFMGSKRKLLGFIGNVLNELEFDTVLDAFSGSGVVSYMFKGMGKQVTSNDFLKYSYQISKATIENNHIILDSDDINALLKENSHACTFIQDNFNGLYFNPVDNAFLDNVSANIKSMTNEYKKAIAISSLTRAAMKKQPRGVFTVIGSRYDDGRNDLKLSMKEQFINSINDFNGSVFDNGRSNKSINNNIFDVKGKFDLLYFDPPYYSLRSDNDYIRRYHFVEGLASYWADDKIMQDSKNKRIEKRYSPFSLKKDCYNAFENLFKKFDTGIFLVSYSSNSLPNKEEMVSIIEKYRSNVKVFEFDHTYSFGNQNHKIGNNNNQVKEYLFLGY